jgi:hypothetical protein
MEHVGRSGWVTTAYSKAIYLESAKIHFLVLLCLHQFDMYFDECLCIMCLLCNLASDIKDDV